MATPTEITTGVQTVTATGAVTPTAGVDVSGVTGDYTIVVEVVSMTAAKTARIQIEDTVNAFTASAALAVIDITGTLSGQYSQRFSFRKYQLPNSNFGVASGKARVNVTAIDASATLQLHSWYES
jgi:hypothetical protein